MREFILFSLKGMTTPNFDLDSLPAAGRMDLIARCINSALCVSNGLRSDTTMHIAMTGPNDPPRLLTFNSSVAGLAPDEKTIAGLIKEALLDGQGLKLEEETESKNGVIIAKKAIETFVKEKADSHALFILDSAGQDLREVVVPEDALFIIGDNAGIPKNTEKLFLRLGAQTVSVGKKTLLASHAIVVLQNELDRKTA